MAVTPLVKLADTPDELPPEDEEPQVTTEPSLFKAANALLLE
jgi:hypothetical protein